MEWDLWVAAVTLEEMSKTRWVNGYFGKSVWTDDTEGHQF